MATVTKGGTLPETGTTSTNVHNLVSNATVTNIVNADISAAADIVSTKLLDFKAPTDEATLAGDGTNWVKLTNGTYFTINFIIDGGGDAIETGIKGDVIVDVAATIISCTLLADQSCTMAVDIWKDTYANFPPTDADTITASAVPATAAGSSDQDSTLTGWTKTITAGDVLRFNVDSNDNATRMTLSLKCKRT